MNFSIDYIFETMKILLSLSTIDIEELAYQLSCLRNRKGRLFIIGVGGSAGHASHAVNDFRKICGIEAYAPTDNVSELTARTNDEGWDTVFVEWLKVSNFASNDGILIFSVGGGNTEKNISMPICKAMDYANNKFGSVFGIVGRDGGYTYLNADVCIIIPPSFLDRVTPHTEGITAVIWHLLVSHPLLKKTETKWESTK